MTLQRRILRILLVVGHFREWAEKIKPGTNYCWMIIAGLLLLGSTISVDRSIFKCRYGLGNGRNESKISLFATFLRFFCMLSMCLKVLTICSSWSYIKILKNLDVGFFFSVILLHTAQCVAVYVKLV